MSSADRFHRALKIACIAVAVANATLWLTRGIREFLVYFDPWFVVTVLPATFVLGLGAVPFLMPKDQRGTSSSRHLFILILISIFLIGCEFIFLNVVAVGTFFRGPDWNFYWPWEQRIPKIVPINNIDLSEFFWIHFLGQNRPRNFLLRELPGLGLLFCYFAIFPLAFFQILRILGSRMPSWRLFLLLFLFQSMTFVPFKIALRLGCNIKYIVWSADNFLNV